MGPTTLMAEGQDLDAASTSSVAEGAGDGPPTSVSVKHAKPYSWRRTAVWVVAAGVFFAVASSINPLRTPASNPQVLMDRETIDRITTPWDQQALLDGAGSERLLGMLEGLDTTVWFYAGVMGPRVGLSGVGEQPLERFSLDDLYVIAPELRLDTGLAIMEAPVPIDDMDLDW